MRSWLPTRKPPSTKRCLQTKRPAAATSPRQQAVQKFIPDVPQRARRTIRGNVKVSVRVIVEQDGTVFAALSRTTRPQPLLRAPRGRRRQEVDLPARGQHGQRLMLVKFAFNREGTTAEAVTLNWPGERSSRQPSRPKQPLRAAAGLARTAPCSGPRGH